MRRIVLLARSADTSEASEWTAVIPATAASATSWTWVRRFALAGYAATLIVIVARFGVPTGRLSVGALGLTGLTLTGIGRAPAQTLRVFRDWLPFTIILVAYDQTRGLADALGVSVHEVDVLRAERWLFGGVEPTLWLQHHLYRPDRVGWHDGLATLVYTTHFVATPLLAALLWLRDRAAWLWFVRRVVTLAVAGVVTYCVFPEAPPWMAARDGWSDPVARLSARGWIWLHAGNLNQLLADAQSAGANPVAAMPSLHAAFATLIALTAVAIWSSRWRFVAALYPAAMGFVLVYTGEHYVLDVIAGIAYALGLHLLVSRWEGRRSAFPD